MPRGGKRAGAGRPAGSRTNAEPTTTIRLPLSIIEKLKRGDYQELERLIEDYQFQSEESSPTSPRWDKLREFLKDAETIKNALNQGD